ncbi:hypothetical protein HN734_04005 [Candidatus Woesearchaeota archaeon]|nr:hypothetical protein [Candidatus Woesearchaeota archaeon]
MIKKIIVSICIITLMTFFIVGCGETVEEPVTSPELEEAETVPLVPEDVEVSDNEPVMEENVENAVKEFTMIARKFEFEPAEIRVMEGDTVRITVTSEDVAHGIAISEFDVKEDFGPGETVTVEFVADKKGTFTFFCSVFCGTGHREMVGQLVVE